MLSSFGAQCIALDNAEEEDQKRREFGALGILSGGTTLDNGVWEVNICRGFQSEARFTYFINAETREIIDKIDHKKKNAGSV